MELPAVGVAPQRWRWARHWLESENMLPVLPAPQVDCEPPRRQAQDASVLGETIACLALADEGKRRLCGQNGSVPVAVRGGPHSAGPGGLSVVGSVSEDERPSHREEHGHSDA